MKKCDVEADAGLGLSVLVPVLVRGLGTVRFRGRMVLAGVVDEVGRVGRHEASFLPVHHDVHIVFRGGVATEQAMATQEPEVAGLGARLFGRLGNAVGIGETGLGVEGSEELLEVALFEAEERGVGARISEALEEEGEVVLFPFAPLAVIAEGARSLASCSGIASRMAGTDSMPRCWAAR